MKLEERDIGLLFEHRRVNICDAIGEKIHYADVFLMNSRCCANEDQVLTRFININLHRFTVDGLTF